MISVVNEVNFYIVYSQIVDTSKGGNLEYLTIYMILSKGILSSYR